MVAVSARAFWIPKEGNRIEEWEDGCAFSEGRAVLALSDGASSSYRAAEWASVLVRSFRDSPPRGRDVAGFEHWVAGCAEEFEALPTERGAAWYVDEAAGRGAFATFLGLGLRPAKKGDGEWTAIAVGDSCLFQIRAGKRVCAFPINDPDAFTSTPALVTSAEHQPGRGAREAMVANGTHQPGDTFLLVTDALAHWALRAEREDSNVWEVLSRMRNETFLALVAQLRGAHAIENDDMTLLRATVEGDRTRQ